VIKSLDHLVLTITDEAATRHFYCDGLGMTWITFADDRHALAFGSQKINIHIFGRSFLPHAAKPTPGAADLCFLAEGELEAIAEHMAEQGYPALEGPVERSGAIAPLLSLYWRDPDGNLIEVSRPL